MFEFHSNPQRYFQMQQADTEKSVIPFIEQTFSLSPQTRVLEIGCGTGGVLAAFLKKGCRGYGVELNPESLQYAADFLAEYVQNGSCKLLLKDIYDVEPETEFDGKFNLIILKDVIEHIHNQERLIARLRDFLAPDGAVFFGFPPWQMPFGGHQQCCTNRFLSHCPWYHLLPMPLFKGLFRLFGEPSESLVEIKETGISIERFLKTARKCNFAIENRLLYFLNPIYEQKFGWRARKLWAPVAAIPYLRNFFTTSAYFLLK
jgi:SAM-dependent methyltransferase